MNNDVNGMLREKLVQRFKWGLGLFAAAVISPFVFLAIKGIVGLAAAFAIGMIITQLAPVYALKLANWRMKLLVSEVETNPIETMQTLLVEKTEELNGADGKIADFETEVRNYDDQVDTFKQQYPAEAETYEALSEKMHTALEDMKHEQTIARKELQNLEDQIKKAKAIYKMSLAAQRVTALSKTAEEQVFADIKQQVAFDTVRTELNRTFANLNLALERRRDTRSALPTLKAAEGVVVQFDKQPKELRR
jgi:archaellum component FlaC